MISKKECATLVYIALILIFLTIPTIAEDEILKADNFPFYHETILMSFDIYGNISLTSHKSIESLDIKLSQYPREDEFTEITFLNPYPDYQFKNNSIIFGYNSDDIEEETTFNVKSKLRKSMIREKIEKDPQFPITSISSEYIKYLQETGNINITNQIKNKASELVNGAQGVFEASFRLAEWVNENIEYVSDVETENTVKSASWTYENKKGVCDEITSLFISMSRSVGIPAKYISGVAYTDKTLDFGNHAWAKVYIPDHGWVPFDVTYGEFGWLDSTHVTLSENIDSKVNSLELSAFGTGNSNMIPKPLIFDVETVDYTNYIFPNINLEVNLLSQEIGFESYNLVEAEIYNNEIYYVATDVYINNVLSLDVIGNNKKFIFIPPKSSEKIQWIVKLANDLDTKSKYFFPVEIYDMKNKSAKTSFNVSSIGIIYSESYVNNIIEKEKEIRIKQYSKFINADCDISKVYMLNEESTLNCIIENQENAIINNLSVCFKDSCQEISIMPREEKQITFNIIFNEIGLQTSILSISNEDIAKNEYLNFNVKDIAEITAEISSVETVKFDDEFSININVSVGSVARPKNTKISIKGSGMEKVWEFKSLDIDQSINLVLYGKQLFSGDNEFELIISYEDEIGRTYEINKNISIKLIDLKAWQKFYAFINRLINIW